MYRPPTDPSQYNTRPTQARTSCPSCGAPITPEQDTQIRDQDRKRQESIIEKIEVAGMSPEEQAQYFENRKGELSERFQKRLGQQQGQQQGQNRWGDRPPPNSPLRYTQVLPPEGMKYVYNQQTGQRSTVPIGGRQGQPGQQKPFPTGDLWDRKREVEGEIRPERDLNDPASYGGWNTWKANNPEGTLDQFKGLIHLPKDDPNAIHGGTGNPYEKKEFPKIFPTANLFQRKQQETGFYQGPSAAEQKKGAIWGAPKKLRLGQSQRLSNFGAMGNQGSSSQYQKLPNFGATGNQGNSYMRDRRKSIQNIMGKMY